MEPPVGQPMSKADEELEIQALRRVISAYLNYPTAADEDVKRWERSYSKLSPAHKALLPHLPKKYDDLRRCVKTNTYFVMNMLQAFDPPFEMDAGIGSDLDEPTSVDCKVADKIMHSHEGVNCCGKCDNFDGNEMLSLLLKF